MMFLNPAVLFGLLAASIPVLIHLLNLRKLQRVEFSTLAFLKELQKNKIRKIKLKQWLLLLLRVLIIVFIVLGFARPALKGIALGGTTSAAKTTAVFIIDDTFSMSVIDNRGSYLNQAKAAAKDLLNNLQEGDEAAVILVSDAGNGESSLTGNLSGIADQINETKISDKSGSINHAIIKASEIISGSDNFNKEIYLLSDFQKGKLAEENEIADLSAALNERVKIYVFNFSGKDVFNLGIDQLTVNTRIFEKNKPVSFSAEVTNYSNRAADNAVVSLFINGERSAQQSISLNAGETKVIDMETPVKYNGFIEVSAALEDDDVNHDNVRFADLYIPERINVVILEESGGDSRFIHAALSAGSGRELNIEVASINRFNSINLDNYDAVIITGSGLTDPSARLKSYVEAGGGVMIMPGSNTELKDFNNLASSLGLAAAEGESGTRGEYNIRFGEIDFEHPLFQNIFLKEEKKQIESPEIYRHIKLNTSGRSIIKLADGSSFLSEYKSGKGKVLLLGAAPLLSWGSLPLKSIFVPLMNKSVYYLSSGEYESEKYTAGEEIQINLKDKAVNRLTVIRPDKSEEILEPDNSVSFLSYRTADKTGIYKFTGENSVVDYVSVNAEPSESITEYIDISDFRNYLDQISFKGDMLEINKDDDVSAKVLQARFGTELWKIFLIIALILAAAEMLIARSARKDIAQI